ncbi:hypothetical protein LEL_08507 [Akanthomyces lecanii RCEF 1005]|uniref:GPI anchored protein n=1 Tax=Akanthomyces lecanii RCEF 1005 TaxID=1081108 RepID=A0A168DKI1_CORDF|nr:hypothetical protein LEL_08507 [Akanthomyces lecanii RCEF 1005]
MLLLPASLLAAVLQASSSAAVAERSPTALRKLAPDANEKIFPQHLAFASLSFGDAALAAHQFLDAQDAGLLRTQPQQQPRPYRPAFARHHTETEGNALRRAAEVLALLQRRSAACPSGMSGCSAIGQPNKCCQDGTVCTKVDDASVGGIACCPQGSSCGGRVGACPSDATSCAADLGGGCCIPGYVCQGMGCVPSASATATTTVVATSTHAPSATTITSTQTTWVDGAPSTVIVTQTITLTSSRTATTKTTTKTVTESESGSSSSTVTGGAPWRPTGTATSESSTTITTTGEEETSTQEGCPTGFYGCLATHGGGCCQTDRDCQTHSCPPQASTTVVSNGKTVVVPASDVPSMATSTCAAGWFLCGTDAGARAGCCPSGYDCGTASCFSVSASQTGSVQKEQPKKDAVMVNAASMLMMLCVAAVAAASNVMVQ